MRRNKESPRSNTASRPASLRDAIKADQYASERSTLAPHMAVFCDGQPTPSSNPELSLADRVFDPIGADSSRSFLPITVTTAGA